MCDYDFVLRIWKTSHGIDVDVIILIHFKRCESHPVARHWLNLYQVQESNCHHFISESVSKWFLLLKCTFCHSWYLTILHIHFLSR